MDDLRLRELEIRVRLDGDPARVSWHGISDHPEVGAELSPYLDRLAGSVDGVAIEVDFTAMEYMNSATIAPIVRFVRALDARCSRVSVIYDAKRTFQRTTFSAIKALGIVLRRLEVRAREQPGSGDGNGDPLEVIDWWDRVNGWTAPGSR